jgi:hypothetical protein
LIQQAERQLFKSSCFGAATSQAEFDPNNLATVGLGCLGLVKLEAGKHIVVMRVAL